MSEDDRMAHVPGFFLGGSIEKGEIINGHYIETGIVQGGMGPRVSLSRLASAVANEGGLGIISATLNDTKLSDIGTTCEISTARNLKALRSEINLFRALAPGKSLGVNVMIAASGFDELVNVCIEEEVEVIFVGSGMIDAKPEKMELGGKTKIGIIASRPGVIGYTFKKWYQRYGRVPDAVVIEGPMAGGHLGLKDEQIDDKDFSLDNLLKQAIDAVNVYREKTGQNIPIIAAGGLWTGSDIDRVLKLGASAAQFGTKFVTTHECDASLSFKKKYIASNKEDIIIMRSPVGLPCRAISTPFVNDIIAHEEIKFKCNYKCLKQCKTKDARYCIAKALLNAQVDDAYESIFFVGANSWRCKEAGIIHVKELMDQLNSEYCEKIDK
jgi:nitronate monooxygenase